MSDSAITPKMQIWLSRYERPVEITRGRRAASTTMATTPVAPTRDLSASEARRIEAEPWSQVERSSVREPFLSAATRTKRTPRSRANMIVCTDAVDEMFQTRIS